LKNDNYFQFFFLFKSLDFHLKAGDAKGVAMLT